jgi:starch synthase
MRILYLTREYPPHVYGGAGVHLEHLAREMTLLADVEIRCFGDQRIPRSERVPKVVGFEPWDEGIAMADSGVRKALGPASVGIAFAATPTSADLVHCHTWYSMLGGLWTKILNDLPLVITTHSLEPLRPWKALQLGRGYELSKWIERTAIGAADAIIAVSADTRREILDIYRIDPSKVHVIHNGVDVDVFRPVDPAPALARYGVSHDRPYILFVGRITHQKGVVHLINALREVDPEVQVVLCAGEPDTAEIGRQVEEAVCELQEVRSGVHWIREMVPVPELVRLYSGAALFVCPSIYEPFGIINVEAMATGCPVVASEVGGIPEAVADGETGVLVPFESDGPPTFEPKDPLRFARDLAATINRLIQDPHRRKRMGEASRKRAVEHFSWRTIAGHTFELYKHLIDGKGTVLRKSEI